MSSIASWLSFGRSSSASASASGTTTASSARQKNTGAGATGSGSGSGGSGSGGSSKSTAASGASETPAQQPQRQPAAPPSTTHLHPHAPRAPVAPAAASSASAAGGRGSTTVSVSVSATATTTTTTTTATTSTSPQRQVTEARDALVASIGNMLDGELQSRAAMMHGNMAAIARQQRDVERAAAGLRRENDRLERVAADATRRVKEIGNVQNWAEVLEKDFLVLGETLRLAARGRERERDGEGSGSRSRSGSGGSRSWSGSEGSWSGSGSGSDGDGDGGSEAGREGKRELDGDVAMAGGDQNHPATTATTTPEDGVPAGQPPLDKGKGKARAEEAVIIAPEGMELDGIPRKETAQAAEDVSTNAAAAPATAEAPLPTETGAREGESAAAAAAAPEKMDLDDTSPQDRTPATKSAQTPLSSQASAQKDAAATPEGPVTNGIHPAEAPGAPEGGLELGRQVPGEEAKKVLPAAPPGERMDVDVDMDGDASQPSQAGNTPEPDESEVVPTSTPQSTSA